LPERPAFAEEKPGVPASLAFKAVASLWMLITEGGFQGHIYDPYFSGLFACPDEVMAVVNID
jgi:hypothetical protein